MLITGGAQRIGLALARHFASLGVEVLIHARTRREATEFPVYYADFSQPGAAAELFRQLPPLDLLINNASSYEVTPLADEPEAQMRRQFEVNFFAPLALLRAFAGQSERRERAALNLLDQEIARTVNRSGSYGLSRRLLAAATRELALELAPELRVVGLAPGPVLPPPGREHCGMKKVLASVPRGRPVALAEVVAAAEFLLRSDSLTGEILYLDGGQHLTAGA